VSRRSAIQAASLTSSCDPGHYGCARSFIPAGP
jgi:hypothetical protein